jgi:hypothetical protein
MSIGRQGIKETAKQTEYDGSRPLRLACQEMYVQNLLGGATQREAYREAGYQVSEEQLDSAASQLSSNIKVRARIGYLQGVLAEKHEIKADRLIEELKYIGLSNIQTFVETDGDGNFIFKEWDGLSRGQLAAVESVKVTTTITRNKGGDREYETKNVQFKLHSKLAALEKLGQVIGLFDKEGDQQTAIVVQINTPTTVGSIDKDRTVGPDRDNQPPLLEQKRG